jgi:hypothetical protein
MCILKKTPAQLLKHVESTQAFTNIVIAMTSTLLICILMHGHMKLKNKHDNASEITWKFWKVRRQFYYFGKSENQQTLINLLST